MPNFHRSSTGVSMSGLNFLFALIAVTHKAYAFLA